MLSKIKIIVNKKIGIFGDAAGSLARQT